MPKRNNKHIVTAEKKKNTAVATKENTLINDAEFVFLEEELPPAKENISVVSPPAEEETAADVPEAEVLENLSEELSAAPTPKANKKAAKERKEKDKKAKKTARDFRHLSSACDYLRCRSASAVRRKHADQGHHRGKCCRRKAKRRACHLSGCDLGTAVSKRR